MSRVSLRPVVATAFAAAVCLVLSPRMGAAQKAGPIERFVARAVDMSAAAPAPGGRIDIMIERWSTEEEQDNVRRTLIESGSGKLLTVLLNVKRRVGFVQFPGQQGAGARVRQRRAQNLLFAQEIETSTGRQVVVATDEHLRFGTARKTLPSEREFRMIDIRFGPNGKGVGKLALATQVTYNKETKTVELGNYGEQPVLLTEVRSEKP